MSRLEQDIPNIRKIRKKACLALNLYHFINDAIVFLIPTLMATLYEEFNLNFTQTSLILALNLGAIVVFQVFNGYLVDKKKEKTVYLVGLPLMTISIFLLMTATDFKSLLILSILNGIGLSFIHSLVYTIGIKLFPDDQEETQSRMAAFGDMGKILSIFSSAIMLVLNRSAWKIPLIFWGCTAIVIFLISLSIIPQFPFKQLNASLEKIDKFRAEEMTIEKKNNSRRSVVLLFIAFFFYTASDEIIAKPFAVYFRAHRTGLSSEYAEILYIIFAVFGTLGVFLSGKIKSRIGFHKLTNILYIGQIITLISFILLDLDNITTDIIFSILLGLFITTPYITIQSEIGFHMEFKRLGLGYASLLSFGWLGGFIFQIIAGNLADTRGEQWYFILALILSLIVILSVQFIPKRAPTSMNHDEITKKKEIEMFSSHSK